MNDILKQRLVGALILVALGVVFWPIIFVEPGDRTTLEAGRIPQPPSIDTSSIAAPEQGGLRGSAEWEPVTAEIAAQTTAEALGEPVVPEVPQLDPPQDMVPEAEVAPTRTRTSAPQQPAVDSKGVPVAWILQVASVSDAVKAEALRDRLLAMGNKAYVKKIERANKALYRVYIGPNFERAQLEKLQAEIDSGFGVKSLIVRYLP